MNGRLEDPITGRMLSVDPIYQAPTNSQSVNPYSYVMNNPLSLVDPSGYESQAIIDGNGNGGSGPAVSSVAAGGGSSCSSSEGVSACAAGLQNGQSTSITDGNGNVIGTVGKDSSGNLLVTGGNGSNFNQTPQFTTTVSGGGMVETSGGGVTVGGDFNHGNGAVTTADSDSAQHQPGSSADIGKQSIVPGGTTLGLAGTAAAPTADGLLGGGGASGLLTAIANAVVALAGSATIAGSATLTGDTPGPTVNHYTDAVGYAGIMALGAIRPSTLSGKSYFTLDTYSSGLDAQKALQLKSLPIGYFRIPIQNVEPMVPEGTNGDGKVPNGTGSEFTVMHPVSIEGAIWIPITP